MIQAVFKRKPISESVKDAKNCKLERSLGLFDLVCIGVGGSVGSGILVLTGLIANRYAGPGVVFSWIIAGIACTCSALSYAELSTIIPSTGSSFAYVYVGLGEYPAFLAAWCLTLEYGMSSAAVAISWGNKMQNIISHNTNFNINIPTEDSTYSVNILGGLLHLIIVILLLRGIDLNKRIINIFTILKLVLILLIICCGFTLFQTKNISSWIPFGIKGVFRGAVSCFFGYVGFDEVTCFATEAKDPQRVIPLAVLYTIIIVTIFYVLAAIVLVGMQSYESIDITSGFAFAFGSHGWIAVQNIIAVSEIIVLPLGVLVSFLAQPRLQYAVAADGLLPKLFSDISDDGVLVKSIIVAGVGCVLVTTFVPFTYLEDLICSGVLLSFCLTNSSLILLRFDSNDSHAPLATESTHSADTTDSYKTTERLRVTPEGLLLSYHLLCMATCACISSLTTKNTNTVVMAMTSLLVAGLVTISIALKVQLSRQQMRDSSRTFNVPLVPFIPLLGIFINYYLVAQLSWWGLLSIALYLGTATVVYFGYSIHNSRGNTAGWDMTLEAAIVNPLATGDYVATGTEEL